MSNISYIHNMDKLPGRRLLMADEIAAMLDAPLQSDVPLLIQDISLRADLMLLLAETLAGIKLCPTEDCDRCNGIRAALAALEQAYGVDEEEEQE